MKYLKAMAVGILFAASNAMAGPIAVDSGWVGFCFAGAGSHATAGCQNQASSVSGAPFTFTLSGLGLLKVTDAFDSGDIFDIYINSVFAFTTSSPVSTGSYTTNPDVAFASNHYSSGSLLLSAGSYSVDLIAKVSPYNGGGAYLQVASQKSVPEPTPLALLGLGLFGLAIAYRRKA
jgi:hypothetical protein